MDAKETKERQLKAVAETVAAEIEAPAHSPQGVAAAAARRVAERVDVHPANAAKAIAMINEYRAAVVAALDALDFAEVSRVVMKFRRDYSYAGFSRAPIVPTPLERFGKLFSKWGWGGEEIDAAIARIKPEECDSVAVTWDIFEVGGRKITRESIRLGLKPRHSTLSDSEWLAKFPIMKYAIRDGGDIVFPPTRPR